MVKPNVLFDVIIVGAGPAGATAARHCAEAGLKTLLLEKEMTPRYKPCAGGLTAAAVKALGFPLPKHLIERECRAVKVVFDGMERTVRSDETVSCMVTRSALDAHLVKLAARAGTVVREREEMLTLKRGNNGVTVRTKRESYRSPILIGADGYFSRVRKAVGEEFDEGETLFCVIAEIPLGEEEITNLFGDSFLIHYGVLSKGYGWLFPKKRYISAGIGGHHSESKILPALFEDFLERYGLRSSGRVRGCFLPVTRSKHRSYTDRIILTGDAAGFVDAFTGEGIRFALLSGAFAGAMAVDCHEKGDFSEKALKEYGDRCTSSFGNDLIRSGSLTDYMFRHKALVFGTALGNLGALSLYLKTITGELRLGVYVSWLKKRIPFLLLKSMFLVIKLWVRQKRELPRFQT